jgi:adenylate cyclase
VLPFTDMSEKKDQEYFADGMAEEIIDLLVKIPGLKVISRTSSFQFKGKTEDLRSIGTTLGVAYVLQGSVRKSGDHLRVTAQLINAQDGTHLWSQNYDRDLSDVLKMQDEIAISLVRALQIEVGQNGIDSRPALRNAEAYTLYLRGLHARDRFDQEGTEQAIGDFERVLELDPAFAPAELWLGNAYFVLGLYGFIPPTIAFEKAVDARVKILRTGEVIFPTFSVSRTMTAAFQVNRSGSYRAASGRVLHDFGFTSSRAYGVGDRAQAGSGSQDGTQVHSARRGAAGVRAAPAAADAD